LIFSNVPSMSLRSLSICAITYKNWNLLWKMFLYLVLYPLERYIIVPVLQQELNCNCIFHNHNSQERHHAMIYFWNTHSKYWPAQSIDLWYLNMQCCLIWNLVMLEWLDDSWWNRFPNTHWKYLDDCQFSKSG
jgi:hypothetical protein